MKRIKYWETFNEQVNVNNLVTGNNDMSSLASELETVADNTVKKIARKLNSSSDSDQAGDIVQSIKDDQKEKVNNIFENYPDIDNVIKNSLWRIIKLNKQVESAKEEGAENVNELESKLNDTVEKFKNTLSLKNQSDEEE